MYGVHVYVQYLLGQYANIIWCKIDFWQGFTGRDANCFEMAIYGGAVARIWQLAQVLATSLLGRRLLQYTH
jgi:hypothetical protein